MPDLDDWVSSWGRGACVAAWLHRRIRCSHSGVTQELVTGDVMRSDYRLVHRLAAKGWPVILQSLKECFVKSGWRRGKKEMERTQKRGEYKRCAGELNNTWFNMKSLLLPPRRSPTRKDVRETSRETPTTRNKTCLVPGLRSKQIKMNWCKLSDFGEWGRKNAHRSIRLRKQATKDRISTHIQGDNTQWRKGSQISHIPILCGLD